MANDKVASTLANVLADSYNLMVKTHNYHWNVEGPHFPSLHAMFEGQYTELFTAVDEIAERIRALGPKAPGSYKEFHDLSPIKDGDSGLDAKAMVADLVKGHEVLIERAKEAIDAAGKAGDDASEDMMIARVQSHEKHLWMMKSFLK